MENSPSILSFETSPSTELLDAALAKAQGEIDVAHKDAENPFFHSSYADLASVWRACRGPLSKHAVSITQWPVPARDGHVALVTRIAHAGQWMKSGMEIPVAKRDAQGVGSAMTYLRRYTLSAVAGIAPDEFKDDDGNQASGKGEPEPPKPTTTWAQPTGPRPTGTVVKPQEQGAAPRPVPPRTGKPTEAQLARLFAIAAEHGWEKDQVKNYMIAFWAVESTKELSQGQYQALVTAIQSMSYADAMNFGKEKE